MNSAAVLKCKFGPHVNVNTEVCFGAQKKDLFAEIPQITFSLSDFSLFFILLFWGYPWEVGMQLSISPFSLDQRFRPFCVTLNENNYLSISCKLALCVLRTRLLCFEDLMWQRL